MPRDLTADRGAPLIRDEHFTGDAIRPDELEEALAQGLQAGDEPPPEEEDEEEDAPSEDGDEPPPDDAGGEPPPDDAEYEIPGIGTMSAADIREGMEARSLIPQFQAFAEELDAREAEILQAQQQLAPALQIHRAMEANPQLRDAISGLLNGRPVTAGRPAGGSPPAEDPRIARLEQALNQLREQLSPLQTAAQANAFTAMQNELNAVDSDLAKTYGDAYNDQLIDEIEQEAARLYGNRPKDAFTAVEYRLVAESVVRRHGLAPRQNGKQPQQRQASGKPAPVRLVPGRTSRRTSTPSGSRLAANASPGNIEAWMEQQLTRGGSQE